MSGGGSGGGGIGASLGGIIGGFVGEGKASGDLSKSQGYAESAYNELLNLGLPPDLSKQLVLEKFQQAGLYTPEMEQHLNQVSSATAQMQENPDTRNAQIGALTQLQQLGRTGLNAEDRAALSQIHDQTQSNLEGKRQQIMQSMQARGMGGSGAELISQLQSSQGGANSANRASLDIAGQAQSRALQALTNSGGLAGNIRGQDYTTQLNKAQAQDELNRFNVQNQTAMQQRNIAAQNQAAQQNLANKQSLSNLNTEQSNQEQQRANEAKRQYYQDLTNRAKMRSGAFGGLSNEFGQRANDTYNNEVKRDTAMGGLVEKAVKAIATYGGSEVMGGGGSDDPNKNGTARTNTFKY